MGCVGRLCGVAWLARLADGVTYPDVSDWEPTNEVAASQRELLRGPE
jgi:hypothetical protein